MTGADIPPDVARWQEEMLQQAKAAAHAEDAANDRVGGRWRSVSRIKGSATISYRSEINEGGLQPSVEWLSEEEVNVRFEMIRDDDSSGQGSITWRAQNVQLAGMSRIRESFDSGGERMTMASDASYRGPAERPQEMQLTLSTEDGQWQIGTPGHTAEKYTVTRRWNGQRFENNQWVGVNETETEPDDRVPSVVFLGAISDQPGQTVATYEHEDLADGKSTRPNRTRGRLEFWPDLDDYELVVTIDEYARWRPLGVVAAPDKPGNNLTAKATVVPKGGGQPAQVKAIRFELLDVSREPGVCLNWPLAAKDSNPDLKLAVAPECPGELSEEDQRLEVKTPLIDGQRQPYALGRIDSYDFGGRATLRVTCELVDGRELVGEMKGEEAASAKDLIPLPRMSGPDWIATVWKEENGAASLPDADDSEKVEGQLYDGDGFTLYEEYRGWVVNGQRVEGDPKRKDFFVMNMIGADARGGIALFARAAQLRVHSGLKWKMSGQAVGGAIGLEMNLKERLMNGNRRDAPQRVKQHGVILTNVPRPLSSGRGGDTYQLDTVKPGYAARPATVSWIFVEGRGQSNGVLGAATGGEDYNLNFRDAAAAYDRAVAHELAHSVGAEHHGEAMRRKLDAYYQGPADPLNPTGKARFVDDYKSDLKKLVGGYPLAESPPEPLNENPTELTLLWEDSRKSLVEDFRDNHESRLENMRSAIQGRKRYLDITDADLDQIGADETLRNLVATVRQEEQKFVRQLAELKKLYPDKDRGFWESYNAENYTEECKIIYVGEPQGTDSGNELCLMRYYFATAYKIEGRENAFYVIRPGSNRIGRDLCRSGSGTGGNASSHKPQSRFGDAFAGRGNCFGQICPNDAIPPPKTQ